MGRNRFLVTESRELDDELIAAEDADGARMEPVPSVRPRHAPHATRWPRPPARWWTPRQRRWARSRLPRWSTTSSPTAGRHRHPRAQPGSASSRRRPRRTHRSRSCTVRNRGWRIRRAKHMKSVMKVCVIPAAMWTPRGDPNAPEGDDWRTRGQFGARAPDTYYRNLPAFVEGFDGARVLVPPVQTRSTGWVADWWRWPQLVFPLDAMWRAYEAARRQPNGMMVVLHTGRRPARPRVQPRPGHRRQPRHHARIHRPGRATAVHAAARRLEGAHHRAARHRRRHTDSHGRQPAGRTARTRRAHTGKEQIMSQDAEDGLDQLLGSWNSHARPTILSRLHASLDRGLRNHEVRAELKQEKADARAEAERRAAAEAEARRIEAQRTALYEWGVGQPQQTQRGVRIHPQPKHPGPKAPSNGSTTGTWHAHGSWANNCRTTIPATRPASPRRNGS